MFPESGIDQVILEGESGSTLAFGPGRMIGSARLGTPGKSVIWGHLETSFKFLEQVRFGDRFTLETPDGRRHPFAVTDILIQDAARIRLRVEEVEPRLVFVTCYPFDGLVPVDLRYLVFADPLKS